MKEAMVIPEIGSDIANITVAVGTDLSKESLRMTNEAMKQLLIYLIRQAKERGNKVGENALKNLLKGNEEIKMFDLEKDQLKRFAEQAKKFLVSYAVIEQQGQLSVFYKASEELRIQKMLENLVTKEFNHSAHENTLADKDRGTLAEKRDEVVPLMKKQKEKQIAGKTKKHDRGGR